MASPAGYWLSLALLLFTGFGMMQQMAASNTILQTIVEEDKRGRVMSFYAMAFLGMAPFGSLLAGVLAARVGAPLTLAIGGAVCLAARPGSPAACPPSATACAPSTRAWASCRRWRRECSRPPHCKRRRRDERAPV